MGVLRREILLRLGRVKKGGFLEDEVHSRALEGGKQLDGQRGGRWEGQSGQWRGAGQF